MALAASTETQYRTVNSLAIAALLFGVASALALVSPLLLAVPMIGVGVACLALRQIAANADIYSGRGLAYSGLFLALFFLAYTPVRLWLRSERLNAQAEQLAESVLTLLQEGKYQEAYEVTDLRFGPPLPGESPTETGFDKFKAQQWMKSIEAIAHQFTYRLDRMEPVPSYDEGDAMVMRYLITPTSGAAKRPFPIWIHVTRRIDPKNGIPSWKIQHIDHRYGQS